MAIIFYDPEIKEDGDGTSWENSFNDLQKAINETTSSLNNEDVLEEEND